MSKSIESYYQESGRAGRDNLPAECIILYQKKDFSRVVCMLRNAQGFNKVSFKNAMNQAQKMQHYCQLKVCEPKMFMILSCFTHIYWIIDSLFIEHRMNAGESHYLNILENVSIQMLANMVLIPATIVWKIKQAIEKWQYTISRDNQNLPTNCDFVNLNTRSNFCLLFFYLLFNCNTMFGIDF